MLTALALASLLQCGPNGCAIPQRQGLFAGLARRRQAAPYVESVYYYQPPAATYAAPAPQLYRLADSAGQAWQHADPNYLRAWVAGRNAAIAAAKARPAPVVCPLTGGACKCAAGECGKAGCSCQAVAPGPPRPDVGL